MLKMKNIVVCLLVFACMTLKATATTVIANNFDVTSTEKSSWSFWGDNLTTRLNLFISNDSVISNKDFTYSFSVDKNGNVVFKSVSSSDLKNLKLITTNMKSVIAVLDKNAIVKFPLNSTQASVIVKGTYNGKGNKNATLANKLVLELPQVSATDSTNTKTNAKTSSIATQKAQSKKTVNQLMIDGELVNVQTVDIGEETVSSVVWNQWRADVTNTFYKTTAKYPFGRNKEAVKVKYSFDIDNNGNISNPYVTPYDNNGNQCSEETRLVILDSVKTVFTKMQHSLVLKFPEGSKRSKVTISGTYVPANKGRYVNASDYNDVETVRTVN